MFKKLKLIMTWPGRGILIILAFLLFISPVFATGGILPANKKDIYGSDIRFVYSEIEPGAVIEDAARILNTGSQKAETYELGAFDAVYTQDGAFSFINDENNNKDLGGWITLSKKEVTVAPGNQVIVPFTIKVPEDAEPGDHAAAIAVKLKDTRQNVGGMKIVTRVGCRVYLTIAGEVKIDLRVIKILHEYLGEGKLRFSVVFDNKGNIRHEPVAKVHLRSLFKDYGTMEKVRLGTIFPGNIGTGTFLWKDKVPWLGRFVADFEITYKDNRTLFSEDVTPGQTFTINKRYVFWILPYRGIAYVLLVLLLLIVIRLAWQWLIVAHRRRVPTFVYTVKEGDTLTKISQETGIPAKKIAKFNLLTWPYDLEPGEKLLIPIAGEKLKPLKEGLKKQTITVIVEEGDTLDSVAEFAGVSKQTIIRHNKLKAPYRLRKGQKLEVPVFEEEEMPKRRPPTARPPTAKPEVPEEEPKKIKKAPPEKTEEVVVEEGDTIVDVASFAGTTWEKVAELNNLEPPYILKPGQKLMVPAKKSKGKGGKSQ